MADEGRVQFLRACGAPTAIIVQLAGPHSGSYAWRMQVRTLLLARHFQLATHEVPGGSVITAILPAHNEAAGISAAVRSLQAQSVPPDVIWVIADNCTDNTAGLASDEGARVFLTAGNTNKKAGALNQFLASRKLGGYVLVMDADSTLSPDFIATAVEVMEADPLTVVGGVFYGDDGGRLVGLLQRNEYCRYARDIYSKSDKAMVLTGTATMHRTEILREIAAARGTSLPGTPGEIYDTAVLTEDNEITLAIKTLGYRCVSPAACRVHTEVMPTWRALWQQRLRWQRGALENIQQYGPTKVTRPYMLQQAVMMFGVVALMLYLAVTCWQFSTHQLGFTWLSLFGVIFVAERAVTVAARGWKHQLLASTLLLEFVYDVFLQAVLIKSVFNIATGKEARWHHASLTGE